MDADMYMYKKKKWKLDKILTTISIAALKSEVI